jgi:outer membrane protein TolC
MEIKSQKEDRLNKLETLLAQAKYNRNATRIKFNVQTDNLKQANDAEEILIKNYETGTINFNDVLDVQELQLKFQINLIESIKGYYIQSSIINYLIK